MFMMTFDAHYVSDHSRFVLVFTKDVAPAICRGFCSIFVNQGANVSGRSHFAA
jgi:hypothetical protein